MWVRELRQVNGNDMVIGLAGNKADLATGNKRQVDTREITEYAEDNALIFLETSAKTGQNVELAFMATAQALLDKHLSRKNPHNGHSTLNDMVKMSGISSMNNNRDNYNHMASGVRNNGWCCY